MTTTKLTKIAPGHYRNDKGEARNIFDGSGAPHVRDSRARWLVKLTNGRTHLVPTLRLARLYLA